MSGDQNRRTARGNSTVTVRAQPLSDKTYVESVVDFLHEVVPQAVAGGCRTEDYDHISWVKLEKYDIESSKTPHEANSLLFLVIGYTNGYQIWHIKLNGEAEELVSVRQGPVKVVHIVQTPNHEDQNIDMYHDKRPLLAVCDAASSSCPFSTVKFLPLGKGDLIKTTDFKSEVYSVHSNKRVTIVCLSERIAVLDASTLSKKFAITNCYPSCEPNVNPVSLGSRWLAFADRKLLPVYQSRGGVSSEKLISYTSAVFNAAKTISKGLSLVGETVGRLTGSNSFESQVNEYPQSNTTAYKSMAPGTVTVIDIENHYENEKDDELRGRAIAHFQAHNGQPIAALSFDPSGSLLFTADTFGQDFHIFRILPHPMCPSLGSVHHLYTLHRGDTMATVCNVAFNNDSRWITVTTRRGTTHLFPITSYGGSVSLRTHNSSRVVNRSSRFHTSAGLEDLKRSGGNQTANVFQQGSPTSSLVGPFTTAKDSLMVGKNGLVNPRMPPFPPPDVILACVQIKLGASSRGSTAGNSTCNSPTTMSRANGFFSTESVAGSALFAASRAWITGNSNSPNRIDSSKSPPVDPLFVISNYGTLVEFNIDIEPLKNSPLSEEMPFQATAEGKGRWIFFRRATMAENRASLVDDIIACQSFNNMNKPRNSPHGITLKESSESFRDDNWLANIEIETHAPPHRRLWMGPQFAFKTFQPPGSMTYGQTPESAGATIRTHDGDSLDLYTEELDLQSLRIQPVRSDPLPTPKARYVLASARTNFDENTMFVDNGPESLTDICGLWPAGEELMSLENGKLIESIADAMNDISERSSVSDDDDFAIFPPNLPEASLVNSSSSMSPDC